VPFRTEIPVRFGDLDPAGIVYYPALVHYLHVAFEEFFAEHVGRAYPRVVREGFGLPTVRLEVEFLSPVRYGDRVRVEVAVGTVGRSSIRLRYAGSVEGRDVFRAEQVGVFVELDGLKPTPVPEWLRERLLARS